MMRKSILPKVSWFGRRTEKTVTVACRDKPFQEKQEKVVRFLWDGNTLFHEWEENIAADSQVPAAKVDYKADYVLKLERKEEEKEKKEAEKGERPPESLITWVFQDDFIPRGKITKEGNYSIVSDYLGTPVEAYDGIGEKVWERELDIYGRVKQGRKGIHGKTEKEVGKKNFIPFRFQGQYEDEETGLYYNRFRYYSPEDGCYTQQDPIGLAGGLNLYSYVKNPNLQIDVWGWEDIVYRCLSATDIQNIREGLGIIPKDVSAHASVIEHVLGGSEKTYADQYLSFTRVERFATRWATRNGTGVASIDLDTIQNRIIDLSTSEGRIAYLGDASRVSLDSDIHVANSMARGAKEVLVEGPVSNNKLQRVEIICPG